MRVIPPQYYSGKLPEGYEKKAFFRFDQMNGKTYGVLYSGERVDIDTIKPAPSLAARVWSNVKVFFSQAP